MNINLEIKDKLTKMCWDYILDYLLDENKSDIAKSEVIKKLFSLRPEVKTLQLNIEHGDKNKLQTFNFKYRRGEYPELYLWRQKVIKRDNYKCQKCGAVNKSLHAHHIKRWIDDVDLRFVVENGITLCNRCHKKIHSKTIENNAIC